MADDENAGREAVPMPSLEKSSEKPSLGMRRVRASFNPSGDPNVDALKTVTAHLIDLVEHLKEQGHDPRCCAVAQTAYEEAAMWAVKAATDKETFQAKS
jgi:hypothetical protein